MSLTLYVDGDRWRAHLRATAERQPDLVPVLKGNGYGFGLPRLARRAGWLGVDTVAVGTYAEVPEVASRFDGSLLVLTPWRDFEEAVAPAVEAAGGRLVHTIGRLDDLDAVAERLDRPRIVLERVTSMLRHGFSAAGLREAGKALRTTGRRAGLPVRLEGVAIHLPLQQGSHLAEVGRIMTDVVSADLATRTVWVSHLTDDELASLRTSWSDYTFRPRIGTSLWLGDREALAVRARVLDVHPVERGDVFGYRQRTAPAAGTIVVVAGGTAHGIGLEAPTGAGSLRARAASVARGGLDAAGLVRSPFTIGGKQRLFAEPPHMQASMLFLPAGASAPAVGDEVDVRVRFTTTDVDRVVVS